MMKRCWDLCWYGSMEVWKNGRIHILTSLFRVKHVRASNHHAVTVEALFRIKGVIRRHLGVGGGGGHWEVTGGSLEGLTCTIPLHRIISYHIIVNEKQTMEMMVSTVYSLQSSLYFLHPDYSTGRGLDSIIIPRTFYHSVVG